MHTIQADAMQGQFRAIFEMALNGQAVKVQGEAGAVVIISEYEYNELIRIRQNAQYLARLEASFERARI